MNERPDLLCFSHLRWEPVYQRPQHLLSRAARERRVFFIEEPLRDAGPPRLAIRRSVEGVVVVTPIVPATLARSTEPLVLRGLIDQLVDRYSLTRYVAWFYDPAALPFTHHLRPEAVVYDCIDDPTGVLGAPAGLALLESQLLGAADVVFTSGRSLYQAKRGRHPNLHVLPNAVEAAHFAQARGAVVDPIDQAEIPGPRVGFFGVIDERLDLALLAGLAALRPALQLVMIGPVMGLDAAVLPRAPNLHWLGGRSYGELPRYLAGWDVAMLPYARTAATRFISPTRTPEYLAAGKPVVSTSIADVVEPFGELGLARIADAPAAFARAIDAALAEDADLRWARADRWLTGLSWDRTWEQMESLLAQAIETRSLEDEDGAAVGAAVGCEESGPLASVA